MLALFAIKVDMVFPPSVYFPFGLTNQTLLTEQGYLYHGFPAMSTRFLTSAAYALNFWYNLRLSLKCSGSNLNYPIRKNIPFTFRVDKCLLAALVGAPLHPAVEAVPNPVGLAARVAYLGQCHGHDLAAGAVEEGIPHLLVCRRQQPVQRRVLLLGEAIERPHIIGRSGGDGDGQHRFLVLICVRFIRSPGGSPTPVPPSLAETASRVLIRSWPCRRSVPSSSPR